MALDSLVIWDFNRLSSNDYFSVNWAFISESKIIDGMFFILFLGRWNNYKRFIRYHELWSGSQCIILLSDLYFACYIDFFSWLMTKLFSLRKKEKARKYTHKYTQMYWIKTQNTLDHLKVLEFATFISKQFRLFLPDLLHLVMSCSDILFLLLLSVN